MIPFPDKKYQIIYADPPWRLNNPGIAFPSRRVERHYPTMMVREICLLPVGTIADKDCMLFMWVICIKLNEFDRVIQSWGFEYKTVAFVWIKENQKNGKITRPFIGMGNYTRANAELCIVATKGHPHIIDHSISQIVFSPRGRHSEKPDVIRKKIVQLCGDLPRIELFARPKIDLFGSNTNGWNVWGNEVC